MLAIAYHLAGSISVPVKKQAVVGSPISAISIFLNFSANPSGISSGIGGARFSDFSGNSLGAYLLIVDTRLLKHKSFMYSVVGGEEEASQPVFSSVPPTGDGNQGDSLCTGKVLFHIIPFLNFRSGFVNKSRIHVMMEVLLLRVVVTTINTK